ncbi:hypothetical protein TRIUR3_34208 [Triticum urartu]|uniref:Uncharacterized protein n=3 Tax=Triticum urartu TaxID=4572 RepID=M7ZT78_TRIUA|nr:hypothetical protein TRIUR3_34208 [Triticum urartu]
MATASSFAAVFISSAIASCFAEVCTIPLDTAKVRLQLQKKTAAGPAATVGMLGTMMSIAREEGVSALWKGIIPGFHRQCLYGGLPVGFFCAVVKALFVFVGDATLMNKILAALTTGVIAIAVANPTDLVKVRLQADGKSTAVKRHYSGALNAYATIVRQMFLGLPGFTDNVYTHLLAGLGAGIFAVCIGSPVDVVLSAKALYLTISLVFYINEWGSSARGTSGRLQRWSGVASDMPTTAGLGDGRMLMDARRMVALSGVVVASTAVGLGKAYAFISLEDGTAEDGGGGLFHRPGGLAAFYKGFIANFCRVGSWNVIMFLTLEQRPAGGDPP